MEHDLDNDGARHLLRNVLASCQRIERTLADHGKALAQLDLRGAIEMAELDDLKAAVARDTEVDSSAITLLQGLKAKLDAAIASGDPAALKSLSDQLGANAQGLADAVTQNTPAE